MRIALVTGANRGVGLAIARALAERRDVRVIAAARGVEAATAAAAEVGHGAVGVELDLSDPLAVEDRARAIDSQHGPVDILVNNAGVNLPEDGLGTEPASLSLTLAVNTVAPFALIRALGPGMKSRGWGRIVNVSSGWGSFGRGLEGPTAYSTSKAALNVLTVSLARELGPEVKVNSGCPGWVRTRMGGDAADRSAEAGAAGLVWLATLPDDGPTGGFFRDGERLAW